MFNRLELMPFGSSNIFGCQVELAKANFRLGLNLDFSTKFKFLSFNENRYNPSDLDDEGLKPSLLCLKLGLTASVRANTVRILFCAAFGDVLLHSWACH